MPFSLDNPDFLPVPTGYSHVAKIDLGQSWMLLISGQVALDRQGNVIGKGDFARQTEQVYSQLIDIITSYGGTKDHLVRTGIFILDGNNIQVLREIRNKYINTVHPPSSTAVVVSRLFRDDLLVEIEATVVVPKKIEN
jgi:enamine deaminase RidA (YjgF/YER057c/UK114 family)